LFGREPGELASAAAATPAELLGPDDAGLVEGWLRQARDSGQTHVHEWRPGGTPPRVWDCRVAPLAGAGGAEVEQLLLVASDVTEQRAAEQARLEAAIAQRELLVREVHHRIKNNLQGVAGLLMQNARRAPELAAPLHEAVGQVQAIAQVYGLQVGEREMVRVARLVEAIASSVGRTFGREIRLESAAGPALAHLLPESESIPVALVLNELFTNAIKHGLAGASAPVLCTLAAAGEGGRGVTLGVRNAGRLPEGFDLTRVRGGVSGLGLVRALLPRRSATLALQQEGDDVVARVDLNPPGVRLPD
jgi:two-component sensor histidine kinase